MSARHLVVGLDGADLGVIEAMGPDRLPTLFGLMERGAYAALASVKPPATLPNWLTFLTALDPGAHGVFDFTLRRGYDVTFAGGTARTAPLLAERLDRMGFRTATVAFPATWPPPRLSQGVFISGWDSPVAFEAGASHVWPETLHDELRARFGSLAFDDVDEFHADAPGWNEMLPDRLRERIIRKAALGRWLLARESWDLFSIYFGESDTAAHYLWPFHDPESPRRPPGLPRERPTPLECVYSALDEALGELVAAAGEDVEITVVSDHGSGGAGDKVLYLNRVLEDAGLLAFRKRGSRGKVAQWTKQLALRALPAKAKERAFRAWGGRLPGWLESAARFGSIDMARTRAFSDELNYFPSVTLNVRGREPRGVIDPRDLPAARREVEKALRALRDPWTGQQAVAEVLPREEVFRGPMLERAPDLIVELALDRGYSYNLMPSAQAPAGTGAWRKLADNEYLGRKGRSLPGSHRSHGLFVAAGPGVNARGQVRAGIADAAVTMLARMNVAPPAESRGRVLWEILVSDEPGRPLVGHGAPNVRAGDTAEVERRLRALGYID